MMPILQFGQSCTRCRKICTGVDKKVLKTSKKLLTFGFRIATNASREVEIVLTTLDKFELWVGPRMIGKFDSFDEAKRNAEAIVPFTIKWED